MSHHTKDKGDTGVGRVIADLIASGVQVALPLSEHMPFDLIAIDPEDWEVRRVSVKFRSLESSGRLEVRFRSSWADRNGTQHRHHDKTEYDVTAIHCPDTGECYYVLNEEAADQTFTLRVTPPKNGQTKGVRFASEYRDPRRIFGVGRASDHAA